MSEKSSFARSCKERPLSVFVYLVGLFVCWSFAPHGSLGFMIGFLFADYQHFKRTGKSAAEYIDRDYFQAQKGE